MKTKTIIWTEKGASIKIEKIDIWFKPKEHRP